MIKNYLRALKTLVLAITLFSGASAANAVTITIDSYDNGWYRSNGLHRTNTTNVIAGPAYNNWFAFDLSNVTGNVTSAILTIIGRNGDYSNFNNSALYEVYDVSTSVSALTDGSGGTAAYNDLETGTLYGSTSVATPGFGLGIMPEVSVILRNALDDINAAKGGKFAVGGSTDATRFLWGYSRADTAAKLTLSTSIATVPLPAALSMLGFSIICLGFAGRRKSK